VAKLVLAVKFVVDVLIRVLGVLPVVVVPPEVVIGGGKEGVVGIETRLVPFEVWPDIPLWLVLFMIVVFVLFGGIDVDNGFVPAIVAEL
jgi:hypothetical protein